MANDTHRLLWLSVCCNILLLLSGAKGLSTKGNEFFFAFMGNDRQQDPNDQNAMIFVTTEETQPVEVTVEVNPIFYLNNPNLDAIQFPQTSVQTVVAGSSAVFEFPVNVSIPGTPFPLEDIRVYDLSPLDRNSGIRVSTDGGEVSVYAINNELSSIDTFSVYPCHTYPTIPENAGVRLYEYVLLSARSPIIRLSRLLVVGCEDDTSITIIPSSQLNTIPDTDPPGQTFSPTNPLTITINRLQSYLVENGDDLTGSRVTSTQPIALFGGHECAEINSRTCDHVVQQLPPEPTWGEKFFILPVPQRYSGEHYRAATTTEETSINVTCRTLGDPVPMTQTFTVQNFDSRLNTGWIPFNTSRATSRATRTNDLEWCCVESSTPILLMQYSSGSVFDQALKDSNRVTFGDPFMAIVPPIRQYTNDFTVPTTKNLRDSLFASLTIAVPQSEQFFRSPALDQTMINIDGGQFMPDEGWVEIFCSSGQVCGYGGRLQSAPEGTVTVRHGNPLAGISVWVYGIGAAISFGYNAGFNLDPIAFPDLLIENVTVNELDGQATVRIRRIGNTERGSRFLLRVVDQSAISLGPDDEIDYFLNYTINPPDSRVQDINETTSELRMRGGVSEITITITIQVDSRTETTEMFLLFLTGTRRVKSILTPVGNVTILDSPSAASRGRAQNSPTPSSSLIISSLAFAPTPSLSTSVPFSFTLSSSSIFPSSSLFALSISPTPSLSLLPSPSPSSSLSTSTLLFPSPALASSPSTSVSPSSSSISPSPSILTSTSTSQSLNLLSSPPSPSSTPSPSPSSSPLPSSPPSPSSTPSPSPSPSPLPSSPPSPSSTLSPSPSSSPLPSSPVSASSIASPPSSLLIPSSLPVSPSPISSAPSLSPRSSSPPVSPSSIASSSSSLLIPSSLPVSPSSISPAPSSSPPFSFPVSPSSITSPLSSLLISSSPLLSLSSISPPPSPSGPSSLFLSPSPFPSSSPPSPSRSISTSPGSSSPSLSAPLSPSSSLSSSPTPILTSSPFPSSSSPALVSTPFLTSSPTPSPIPPEIGMGDDPHFSILLPTGQMLCFSLQGEKGFSFNLISNKLMHMNALFIPDTIREEVTWIGSLGIVVKNTPYKTSNVTKLRFEVQEKKVYIGHEVALSVENIDNLSFSSGKLRISETSKNGTEKTPEVRVYLKDVGLSFRVQYKWRHLDLLWDRVEKQPNNSHGIIGQFFHGGIEIDEVRKLLILPGMAPVPVMRRPMWSFMESEVSGEQMCWVAMTHGYQGKGLIQGHYLDYLVEDVLSGDFKFRAKGRRL